MLLQHAVFKATRMMDLGELMLIAAGTIRRSPSLPMLLQQINAEHVRWNAHLAFFPESTVPDRLRALAHGVVNSTVLLDVVQMSGYVAAQWGNIARELKGIEDSSADIKKYLTEQRLLQKFAAPGGAGVGAGSCASEAQAYARQAQAYAQPQPRPLRPQAVVAPRNSNPTAFMTMLRARYMGVEEGRGRCWACLYLGYVAPGTRVHSAVGSCPQLAAAVTKSGLQN